MSNLPTGTGFLEEDQEDQVVVAVPTRLRRNALGPLAVAAMTMANMAPAMSFIFGFSIIAGASGVASPLTIAVAGLAILFLVNTMSQFSKYRPSAGSFVTFIGSGFGAHVGTAFALILGVGFVINLTGTLGVSGGWAEEIIKHYFGVTIPWQILVVLTVAVAVTLMVRGVIISVKWSARFFALELTSLLVVATIMMVKHPQAISWELFSPGHLTNGLSGLGLGFPLAVFLFIGWEDSAAMSEESHDPRRNVGRAMFASVLLLGATYTYLAFATVVGFNGNGKALAAESIPLLKAAEGAGTFFLLLIYISGLTSIFACVLGAVNAQSRVLFSAGREGLLPAFLGKVHRRFHTPHIAILCYVGLGLILLFVWGGRMDPVVYFGESGTLGTILVMLTYLVVNLALPLFMWRHHRENFNVLRHVILPFIGAAIVVLPVYALTQPGQPAPFNYFPFVALGVVAVAIVYAVVRVRTNPGLRERLGSIVADDRH